MDWFPLLLSLRVASIATVLAAVLGVGGAYLLAKGRFWGRGLLEALASLPIVLPPTVLGYYLLVVLGTRSPLGRLWEDVVGSPLVFTVAGAVVAATISALPFCLRTARAAIESVDPRFEVAARTMGLPEWRVALHVTLPLARRGIIAGVALGFARALGDFGATVMVAGNIPGRTQTMPIAIYDAVQQGDDLRAGTMAAILSVVAIGVLLLVNRFSRAGV
ncbi:molybdate ABC transporter permease subunit [Actinotalea sp. K2]|uniref:molybdate ABC transporter permease subunit n=1 Tax=Actinotalea sp. K2 TaxID=2939438 RepID=UPI0020181C47|nr:molybdate ABC transporter permease subunit [Actinotalea sp. K2]MCL3861817.1 molybdate ABC transporter permease subunit [Actinotalea sp. K2]